MKRIFFEKEAGCLFLTIRVTTRASKNSVNGVKNGKLSLSVTRVPENNKANEAVIKTISSWLGVAKSRISIISGEKNRDKLVRIDQEIDLLSIPTFAILLNGKEPGV